MSKVISLIMAGVLLGGLSEQDMRVVVEEALDQPTTLTIDDVPLEDAFAMIAEHTGLSMSMGPEALSYLPYGNKTRVSARLENVRLRDGIQAMCNRIGMVYKTTSRGLEIVPAPALARLGRAATWEELGTIAELMEAHWSGEDADFAALKKRVRFDGLEGSFADNWKKLTEQLRAAGTGRGDELLTRASAVMGCTWYPWDEKVIILTRKQQILHQLQRPVSLRCHSRPLAQVVRSLSREAGVPIHIDPVSASELPARVKQSFSLLAEGVTVQEALEQIGIATGLAFDVGDTGVVLRRPEEIVNPQPQAHSDTSAHSTRSAKSTHRGSDPIVGKVVVPSADGSCTYEWFVRQSDLTEEENVRREKLVKKAIENMKEELPE